jgi:hypothetical protein
MADDRWKAATWLNSPEFEELYCDECGKKLGFVRNFDLNSSYFFCQECVDKAKTSAQ